MDQRCGLGCWVRSAGFTLVELMIVVAIVAALAALAVPFYQGYVARTQFTEALSLFSGVRTAVEVHVQTRGVGEALTHGPGTDDGFLSGHRTSGRYVASIEVAPEADAGAVVVTVRFATEGVSADLAGEEVEFRREADGEWVCSFPGDGSSALPHASGICAD